MTSNIVTPSQLLIDLPKKAGYVGRHRRELTATERKARRDAALHAVFLPDVSPSAFAARVTIAVVTLGSVGTAALGVLA